MQAAQYPQQAGSGVHLAPQQEHKGGALVVLLVLTSPFAGNLSEEHQYDSSAASCQESHRMRASSLKERLSTWGWVASSTFKSAL